MTNADRPSGQPTGHPVDHTVDRPADSAVERILAHGQRGAQLRTEFFTRNARLVTDVARMLAVALARGGKLLFAGNDGSAACAQHLAAEYVTKCRLERPPLPALALTTDTSVLTAISNGYGFDHTFARQLQALGAPGDVLVVLSASGDSANALNAVRTAKDKQMLTVGLVGGNGGDLLPLCDYPLVVPSADTALVQELHLAIGHMLCELTDYYLFEAVHELTPYLHAPELHPDLHED